MKHYQKQYHECYTAGLTSESIFESFKDNPGLLPAFPNKFMQKAIEDGTFSGIHIIQCGKFGGTCSSKHEKCVSMREKE